MNELRKLEQIIQHSARINPQSSRVETSYTVAELRKMGLQTFGGKFTHQVRAEGMFNSAWRTFEIVPGAKT